MWLSELTQVCDEKLEIIKDCEFDEGYLIGKEEKKSIRVLSFLSDKKFVKDFLQEHIDAVICTPEVYELLKKDYEGGICISHDPKSTFFSFHNYKNQEIKQQYSPTVIAESARIHPTAIIAEKGVHIAENVEIFPYAVVKEGTYIGSDSIVREYTVVGTPGFYYFGSGKKRTLVQSSGGVVIGENVEIHTNCVVEKGVMGGTTLIGDNTKIDHSTIIGHDTKIGGECTIAANALFAGGVKVGANTFAGVSSTAVPNVKIGANVKISAGSVITKNVEDGMHVSGNFALEHSAYIRHLKQIVKGDIK